MNQNIDISRKMRTCEQTLHTNTWRIQTKKSSTNAKDNCHFMSNTIKSIPCWYY